MASHHEKYLGIPVLIGRNKNAAFDYLREKIRGQIQGWSKRFLSRAGKEIMLKTIIQIISSYVMSVFRIPHSLCDLLEKIMNSYWWGCKTSVGKGIKWTKWGKLCLDKKMGGIGFRRIHQMNSALLAK